MPPQSQEHTFQSTAASPQSPLDVHSQPYGIFYLGGLVKGNKTNDIQNIYFCSRRLTTISLRGKYINNIHYISSFYYCFFLNRRHSITIRTLVVPKICCLSRLNSWRNLLDPSRKIQVVMSMKVGRNKGICPYFGRNVLDGCIYDHCELPLIYPYMNLPPFQLQELTCLSLVLLFLEFIMCLIESACTSLLLTNLDTLP